MMYIDLYLKNIRPRLNPICEYLLLSSNGTQFQSLTNAMTMLVHQAIKKYINPTRYRQIIETESSERLTSDEQRFISEDQKHSSTVAKIFYKKKHSRMVAVEGKKCMDKMTREYRLQSSNLMGMFGNCDGFDIKILEKSRQIIESSPSTSSEGYQPEALDPFQPVDEFNRSTDMTITPAPVTPQLIATPIQEKSQQIIKSGPSTSSEVYHAEALDPFQPVDEFNRSTDMTITSTSVTPQLIATPIQEITSNIMQSSGLQSSAMEVTENVNKESTKNVVKRAKNVKFTEEEDEYLNRGIKKHGRKAWSLILKESEYKFHNSRTRDSLRVRADSAAFKKRFKFSI